nr:Wadjet anti-phage system protein JetA family protein [Burkholderia cepacia]
MAPFAPGDCIGGERLASPRVETKRPPPGGLRKQTMSPEQEARARLALMARDRRTMSLPKLAAFVRQQLGEADAVPSTALQVNNVESIRALQVLCTIATANATSSKVLRANARAMSSGFTTVRMEGAEVQSQGISHLPFTIARTIKPAKGGNQ